MTTARDIMTSDPDYVEAQTTVLEAARKMDQLGVGALPICGNDERLKGMLTDRDIVVKVLAQGKDPSSTRRRRWRAWTSARCPSAATTTGSRA